MATRTVDDCSKEGKGNDVGLRLKAALLELEAVATGLVAAVLAAIAEGADGAPAAAMLDQRIREVMLETGRRALERGLEADRSDCGAANAPACGHCGGRTRYGGSRAGPNFIRANPTRCVRFA